MNIQTVSAAPEIGLPADVAVPAVRGLPGQGAKTPAPPPEPNQQLRRALDALAERLDHSNTQLSFRVDQDSHTVVISIVDASGAVLRQIPGEEVIRMAQKLQDWLGGLVDERA